MEQTIAVAILVGQRFPSSGLRRCAISADHFSTRIQETCTVATSNQIGMLSSASRHRVERREFSSVAATGSENDRHLRIMSTTLSRLARAHSPRVLSQSVSPINSSEMLRVANLGPSTASSGPNGGFWPSLFRGRTGRYQLAHLPLRYSPS